MKPRNLLDSSSARLLGFDWLVRAVAPVSPYGGRRAAELRPFLPGEEPAARARAEQIAEIAATLQPDRIDALRSALAEIPDASGAIARASLGEVLADPNLLELSRFCEIAERIDPTANDAVRGVGAALAAGRRDGTGFYLADAFAPELREARTRLSRAQAELDAARGREIERIARSLGRDDLTGEEFIVMRHDLRGALPAGVRVLREAPTYLLCALEYDEAALAALQRRDAAAEAAAVAEERVRGALSSLVRDRAAELDAAARALGDLDVLVSAARFTQRYNCVPADISADAALEFEQARFLPLAVELAAAGREFTPLDLDLRDAAVLTGPNMGGKTVCLQTCGFLALCAAFGLPVPAARARTSLFDQIAWLGMGRDDRIGGLLSSFAREVVRLKDILDRNASRLLVLIDEFARTTTPHEGKALLIALLGRLRERGALGMVATHLGGVASAAGARHFAVRGLRGIPKRPAAPSLEEALQALAASMDYTITEVTGDDLSRADAIALTALLGIDDEFVAAAYRALVE
ncbi:MAG: hypothetical protein WA814_00830 [Candidatus Baltobacteraceae bacterium]